MVNRERLEQAAYWCALGSAATTVVSIAGSQILLGAALLCLALKRGPVRFPPILLPLGLFVALTLVSLALSGDPASGLPQVRKFFVYLILLAVASTFQSERDARRLATGWLVLGCATAIRAYWQFGQKWLASGDDFYRDYVGRRITGFMSHWMTFSGLLMVAFLVGVAFLLWGRPARWEKRLAMVALVLTGGAIGLAFTRGVWIGTAAGVLWLLWSWRKWSVLLVPGVVVLALAINPGQVRERALSVVRPRGQMDSNQHRIVTWRTGLEMVKAHPWFGLGPEQVGRQFMTYVPPDIPRHMPEGWYGHLHNNYLQYAAERGVPALLMLLWMIGKVLRDWIYAPPSWVRNAGLAALTGILVTGLFELNLGDSEVLLMTLSWVAAVYATGAGTGLGLALSKR